MFSEDLRESMKLAEQLASLSLINSTRSKSSILVQNTSISVEKTTSDKEAKPYVPPKQLLLYLVRMGSFTSQPKMEAVSFDDETVPIPQDNEEDLMNWVKEQLGPEAPSLLKRNYRHAPGKGDAYTDSSPFRVLQWNILSQALGTHADNFVKCPSRALEWNFRRLRILEELLVYDPDIICLQEVDHYKFFERTLATQGYSGYFLPKPDSPCLYLPDNSGPDGCAVFFKTDRFELISITTRILEVWKVQSNQVAILVLLREIKTRKEIIILTTHLKARKGSLLTSLRNEQGGDLLNFLEKHCQGRPAIVCGDFNAEPSEPVYSRIVEHNPTNLTSAYALLNGGFEPSYSTWKIREDGEAKHNLDYIFYTGTHIDIEGGLDAPLEEEVGPGRVPSMSYPSDHFSLICDFSFMKEAKDKNYQIKSRQ